MQLTTTGLLASSLKISILKEGLVLIYLPRQQHVFREISGQSIEARQKEFFKEVMIGSNIYSVGNFVHLNSGADSPSAKPYIALIQSFYKSGSREMMKVRWLFRTEDTHLHSNKTRDKIHDFGENEVFFSRDEDENDVKTILQRVYVYPDGSAASKQTNPSKPTYSCCLEYIPAKKKFTPLIDTSILSKPPRMKPTFNGEKGDNSTVTNDKARSKRLKRKKQQMKIQMKILQMKARRAKVALVATTRAIVAEIRIGPDYQVMNLPKPNFVSTEKGNETSESNRSGPTLLYDCKTNMLKNAESSNSDKGYVLHQRVYVNLERESKFKPLYFNNSIDQSNTVVDVRLIDGTLRSLPKGDVNSISDVPEHLLYGLTKAELETQSSPARNRIPQLWTTSEKAYRLKKLRKCPRVTIN